MSVGRLTLVFYGTDHPVGGTGLRSTNGVLPGPVPWTMGLLGLILLVGLRFVSVSYQAHLQIL